MSFKQRLHALALGLAIIVSVAGVASADTWSDPAGDAQGGPDITDVTVTNDPGGTITMSVSVPLWPPLSARGLAIWMDTDLNGRETDPADRVIGVWALLLPFQRSVWVAPGAQYASLLRSQDSKVDVPSLKTTGSATAFEVSFARAEVGIDTSFGFWIGSVNHVFKDPGQWSDRAPDSGYQTYRLTLPPPPPPPPVAKPVIGAPVAAPASPGAGRKFNVAFAVTTSTDGTPLTSGTMVIDPSVSGKMLAHSESFKGGRAKASIAVPRTAKGKQLKVKVTIKSGGQSATKIAAFKIR